jgi:hypothetical protein
MKAWLCISLIGSALIGLSGAAQAATLYAPTSSVQAYSNAAGDTALGALNPGHVETCRDLVSTGPVAGG